MYFTMYLDFIMSFPPEQQDEVRFWYLLVNLAILLICAVIYSIKKCREDL